MQISVDKSDYDQHQLYFVRKFCEMLIADLRRAGIDDENGEELATEIAFTACCLLDGSTILDYEGQPFLPCLTFAQDEEYRELLSSGGSSWMHEYVGSTVWDIYHEEE